MDSIREGIGNLVRNCAEVKEGEQVLLLNERGKVEEEIAALIAEVIREAGAGCFSLWGESVARAARSLPNLLVGSMLSADKIISNFSLNRAVVDEHMRGRGIVQIQNTCRSSKMMASEHARFHWGVVRAIYSRIEEVFASAGRWRITSPAGTEISGRVGKASEVAEAYFSAEAEASRFIRVFPGEVYSPVGSLGASGRIVCEYINMKDKTPWEEPVTFVVKEDRIVEIEGRKRAAEMEKEIEARVKDHGDNARVIDSWHGGMNPRARVPTPENPSLQGATSSPALMHFHLGRLKEPISLGILNHTLEVDGKKIYAAGKLLILDDPKIREAYEKFGVALGRTERLQLLVGRGSLE